MQLTLDSYDQLTLYADLRDQESLTDELRARAIERARQLYVARVEFWRPPYGGGENRMAGFVEIAHVRTAPKGRNNMNELASARPADLVRGSR